MVLAGAMLCAPAWAAAQGPAQQGRVIAGPVVAYEFGLPLMLNRAADGPFICDCDGTGTSYSHTFGGGGELHLERLFTDNLGASARLMASVSTGRFTSNPYDDPVAPITGGVIPRNRFTVDARSAQLELQTLATLRLTRRWSMAVGGAIGYRIDGTFVQNEEVVSPAGRIFDSSGMAARGLAAGDRLAAPRLTLAAIVVGAYGITLSPSMELRPELTLRLNGNAFSNGSGFRSFSIGTGIALLFGAGDDRPAPPPPIDSVRAEVRPFTATLDIYGLDTAGNRAQVLSVTRTRLHRREYMSLVPIIQFDRNSSRIPPHYRRYTREETQRFTLDSFARRDQRVADDEMLNVIGRRLRADASATVTLIGSASSDEPMTLSAARAAEVRRYLTGSWGIDTARVSIQPARTGSDEASAPQVIIVSRRGGITSPLRIEWIAEDLEVPEVGLNPQFNGGAGMRRWDITIRRQGSEVARYSSSGGERDHDLDFTVGAAEPHNSAEPAPLQAEIIAEDSAGTVATAHDELPLLLADSSQAIDRFITVYRIGPYDSAGVKADTALLGEMARSARLGDRITLVYPGNDRGLGKANAQRMARMLAMFLPSKDMKVDLRRAPIAAGTMFGIHPDLDYYNTAPYVSLWIDGMMRDGPRP